MGNTNFELARTDFDHVMKLPTASKEVVASVEAELKKLKLKGGEAVSRTRPEADRQRQTTTAIENGIYARPQSDTQKKTMHDREKGGDILEKRRRRHEIYVLLV